MATKKGGALNPKQERFVQEYLIDLNATQAAIRAGYSPKTANEQGAQLLAILSIATKVQEAQAERAKRTGITQDRVLAELAKLAFFDVRKLYNGDGTMIPVTELDDDTAAGLAGLDVTEITAGDKLIGYTKKAKLPNKVEALSLCMRHLGILNDKMNHGVQPDNPLAALVEAVAGRSKLVPSGAGKSKH